MTAVVRAARAVTSDLVALYAKGFSMFRLAPWVLAIVIIPEFAQHIVEISLGMFDSREAARALANDPVRWAFGYAKLAGLMLCFLASARFWWTKEHGGRWYDAREVAWVRLIIGVILFVAIGLLAEPFAASLSPAMLLTAQILLSILSLPFLFMTLAGIFGDRSEAASVRSVLRSAWAFIPLLLILLVAAYGPLFVLHGWNHDWAMGSPVWLVWMLMIFDSLVVGGLAGLTGTAMYLAYRRFKNHAGGSN